MEMSMVIGLLAIAMGTLLIVGSFMPASDKLGGRFFRNYRKFLHKGVAGKAYFWGMPLLVLIFLSAWGGIALLVGAVLIFLRDRKLPPPAVV